ncbi:MAG: OstA family protein, partial [Alphaproteobacteria bacterium]|nr:OstA family protein [Alphaproteobacteria bacterium]
VGQTSSHDSNAPVDIDADHVEVQDKDGRFVWSGNVRVKQADLLMSAQRLTGTYHMLKGNPQLDRLDAQGGVAFTLNDDNAHGDVAVYDLNRKIITLIGAVTLRQGGNYLHAGRLTYDLVSHHATLDGHGPGIGTQSVGGQEQPGRVTGHFTVPQRQQ